MSEECVNCRREVVMWAGILWSGDEWRCEVTKEEHALSRQKWGFKDESEYQALVERMTGQQ